MKRFLYLTLSLTLHFLLPGGLLRAQVSDDSVPVEISSFNTFHEKRTVAHAAYRIESGTLRNVYSPALTHCYEVYISSFYPLGVTLFSGEAGYTRYNRKEQAYSGMLHPASPLITFADTLPGNQKGETYHLAGSIVRVFSAHWHAGLSGEYLAGNHAKDNDPRNKNNLNQITIAPKLQYHTGAFRLSLKFFWQYERETISYRSFGSETKNGVTFYPLWFYTTESFAEGVNSQRDYRKEYYKINLNLIYDGEKGQTAFYPSFSRSNTRIWTNHAKKQSAGEIAEKNFRIENKTHLNTFRYIHRFIPLFHHSRHKVYDIQQQLSADRRIYETILKIKRAEVTHIIAGFHYLISPALHPTTTIEAGIKYKKRNSLFRLPPTDYIQEITQLNFSAGYTRSFTVCGHLLNGSLQTSYSTGEGTQPNLSLLGDRTVFRNQSRLLEQEFRYLTASLLGIIIKLRYTFPLDEKSDFYLEVLNRFHTTCTPSGWSAHANHFKFSAGILF